MNWNKVNHILFYSHERIFKLPASVITFAKIKNPAFRHVDETNDVRGGRGEKMEKSWKRVAKFYQTVFISLHMCKRRSLFPLDLSTLYHFSFKSYENALKRSEKKGMPCIISFVFISKKKKKKTFQLYSCNCTFFFPPHSNEISLLTLF